MDLTKKVDQLTLWQAGTNEIYDKYETLKHDWLILHDKAIVLSSQLKKSKVVE